MGFSHTKNQVMFPVLETLTKGGPGVNPVNHYWMINVNVRDRRFEVLDSLRTLEDKQFEAAAKTIVDGIVLHWETQYNLQIEDFKLIDIDVPKQDNT